MCPGTCDRKPRHAKDDPASGNARRYLPANGAAGRDAECNPAEDGECVQQLDLSALPEPHGKIRRHFSKMSRVLRLGIERIEDIAQRYRMLTKCSGKGHSVCPISETVDRDNGTRVSR